MQDFAVIEPRRQPTSPPRAAPRGRRRAAPEGQGARMEAVGWMTAGVCHDLANLNTALQGALRRTDRLLAPDHPARPYVRDALAAIESSRAAAERLTGFARGAAPSATVEPLDELVVRARPLLEHLLGPRIELVMEPVAPGVLVRVESGEAELVLLNLAANSRDAMPDGGRLIVRARSEGAAAVIEVEDTGGGVPLELQEKVFEPLFTTKPAGRGTGLGLARVRAFAHRSGGRVELFSAPGEGTTICLVLPVAQAVAQA